MEISRCVVFDFGRRLDSNAFVCSCEMMWLKEMLAEKADRTQAAATCEYPQDAQDAQDAGPDPRRDAASAARHSVVNIEEAEFHCSQYFLGSM